MLLKVKSLGLMAGRPVAILHAETAKKLNVHIDERVNIASKKGRIISVVDTAKGMLDKNSIVLSGEIMHYLQIKNNENVEISVAGETRSAHYIREKIKGIELNREKIRTIISDIVSNKLTEAEIAYFVAAEYIHRMSMKEIEYLVESIVSTGKTLGIKNRIIADKHSIGGIAGNRTTPIVVPICSAAGLMMPKTSSRAITSAAGTADSIETIAKVEFSVDEIRNIVKRVNACIVWGGALGLAPADDKIIQVERLLNLDPEAQLLASIISKKVSAGSTHVVIDIPCGKSAKFTREEGKALGEKFSQIGRKFGLKIKTIMTGGDEPVGNGIGPLLEMRDIISILQQEEKRPLDLERKSLMLSAEVLELTETARRGKGYETAEKLLKSGIAWAKFKEIIKAQKGNAEKKLNLAEYCWDIKSSRDGIILEINNKSINAVARTAGCPADKAAGIYLYKHCNDAVIKNEKILTIYSESQQKLDSAKKLFNKIQPVTVK